jgi:beta-phosphoglucomutase-like phosphatase (HAD superfamily)
LNTPALCVLLQAGLQIRRSGLAELKAVFWDVDGTLAETELEGHRPAFNAAFREAGLDWSWDRTLYTELLSIAGGRQRMAAYAAQRGEALEERRLDQLRALKQKHYLKRSSLGAIELRPGVARLLSELEQAGVAQWIPALGCVCRECASFQRNHQRRRCASRQARSGTLPTRSGMQWSDQ